MADYGLAAALSNMYGQPSQIDKKNTDFAEMQQVQTYYDKKRKEKEENALKMQLYDQNVEKFADTLLAPDRDRIYNRARILKSNVRSMIKENGGNLEDFFNNGGHQIMANYKNSIIHSTESSDYLENKQNMSMILKVMNEGKSHLISPVDKINFDNYMANKSGKITYSGIMNDIKLPDPTKYEYGAIIPTQDILNENRAIILSNYATYNKGTLNDPVITGKLPSEQDLLAFTALMYPTQTGNNYQKKIQENASVIQMNQEERDKASFPLEQEKKSIANDQAKADLNTTLIENEQKTNPPEGYGLDGKQIKDGGVNSSNGSNTTGAPTDYFGMKSNDKYNPFLDSSALLTDFSADPTVSIDNMGKKFTEYFAKNTGLRSYLGGVSKIGTSRAQNWAGDISGDMLDLGGTQWFGGDWSPKIAYDLFKSAEEKTKFYNQTAALYGGKVENGSLNGFRLKKGTPGIYSSTGQSLQYGDDSLGNDDLVFNSQKQDFSDDYGTEWKIKGSIVAGVTDTADGSRKIVMNKNGVLAKEAYKGKNKPGLSYFTVVENKDGVRLYLEVDPTNPSNREAMLKTMDVTGGTEQAKLNDAKNSVTKGIKGQSLQNVKSDILKMRNIPDFQAAAKMLTNGARYGDEDFVYSFIQVMQNTVGGSIQDNTKRWSSKLVPMLSKNASRNGSSPSTIVDLIRLRKNSDGRSVSMKQIFQIIEDGEQNENEKKLIRDWAQTYFNLKTLK